MNAYKNTAVPVERSKEAIRKLLLGFKVRGVQFAEDFESRSINVRFAKDVDGSGNFRTVSVSMVVPKPQTKRVSGTRRRWVNGSYTTIEPKDKQEQMYRATYRALHYWLKSNFEAIDFGLVSFEDVFLSHFEWMVNGERTTVGAIVKPNLVSGLSLAAPRQAAEGEIVEE